MPRPRVRRSVVTVWLAAGLAAGSGAWAQPAGEADPALRSYLSGNGLLSRGMYDLAAAEYREFLASNPGHEKAPVARYGLAVALFRTGRTADAAEELAGLRDVEGFEFGAEVDLLLGQCRLAERKYVEAGADFSRLLEEHGSHESADDAASLLAEAMYRAGRHEEAARACGMLAERWPKSPHRDRAELMWGLADAARGKDKEAAARLTSLAEKAGAAKELAEQAALVAAQCHHRAGALAPAAALYRRLVEARSERHLPDALLGLAGVLRQQGDAPGAVAMLDLLLAEFPKSPLAPAARMARGRARFDLGVYEAAAKDFEPASAAEPDRAEYWLAKCDLRLERAERAAARLGRALERYPESPLAGEMLYDRAVALLRAGDEAGSAGALREFREAFPEHAMIADATELLATLEHRAGRFEESGELCEVFVRRFPEHPLAGRVAFLAAENLLLGERVEEAVGAYRAFLAGHPEDERVPLATLRLGSSLYRLGRREEAAEPLRAATEHMGADPAFRIALLYLGDIAFQSGNWAEAERRLGAYLEGGLEAHAADDALLKLGLALAKQKRHEEAVSQWARLSAELPESERRWQAEFERGQSLLALGRTAEAADAFGGVAGAGDERLRAYAELQLGGLALAAGDVAGASSRFERAVSAAPDETVAGEATYLHACALLAAGDYKRAAGLFDRVASRYPSHARADDAAVQRAVAGARMTRTEEALAALEEALAGTATKEDASLRESLQYERAACLKALDRREEAERAYGDLLRSAKDAGVRAHAAVDLADLQIAAGRHEEALKLLSPLAEADPKGGSAGAKLQPGVAYRLAVCEFRMERFDRAAALAEEMIDRWPDDPMAGAAALIAGESLFKLGRFGPAADHLRAAVERAEDGPSGGPALLRLGESLAAVQDWAGSERAFSRHLERFGEGELWFQSRFGLGWAKENQGRLDEAMDDYRQVVERHQGPTAARAQFQIGECLFAKGEHEAAARELLKVDVLYAYPEWSAAALYEAGRCFEALERAEDAAAQFEQVRERFPETRWAELAGDRLASLASAPPG